MPEQNSSRRHFLTQAAACASTLALPACATGNTAADIIISKLRGDFSGAADYPLTHAHNPHYQPTRIPAQIFAYTGTEKTGTVLVDIPDMTAYLVQGKEAIAYPIAVGKEGFDVPYRELVISHSKWWPGWTPTARMRREKPSLQAFYPGGPDNPHGVAKAYLYEVSRNAAGELVKGGYTSYGFHGTNKEDSIQTEASSGCWRMFNRHAADFKNRVTGMGLNLVKIFKDGHTPPGIDSYLAEHVSIPSDLPPLSWRGRLDGLYM